MCLCCHVNVRCLIWGVHMWRMESDLGNPMHGMSTSVETPKFCLPFQFSYRNQVLFSWSSASLYLLAISLYKTIFNIKAQLQSNISETKKLEMDLKEIMCVLQKTFSQAWVTVHLFVSEMFMNPTISVR